MEIATIGSLLTPLALLACPVGMGLMMWMMMRGHRNDAGSPPDHTQPTPSQASSQPPSLEVLREEQRRLSDEIERLQTRHRLTAPDPGRSA